MNDVRYQLFHGSHPLFSKFFETYVTKHGQCGRISISTDLYEFLTIFTVCFNLLFFVIFLSWAEVYIQLKRPPVDTRFFCPISSDDEEEEEDGDGDGGGDGGGEKSEDKKSLEDAKAEKWEKDEIEAMKTLRDRD